jgi:YegS/Rv2252/BmrU family lipid kinase
MRKAALLYNPDSGGRRSTRQRELESVLALLGRAGVDARLLLCESLELAAERTRQAVMAGCDTIFACGGDGTIHNIVQVLANSQVALAILPMGTANALACDLGLPFNIEAAAKAALHGTQRRVALGRIEYLNLAGKAATRNFIVAAGVGVDAQLFYKLHNGTKRRIGMAAYYAKAWRMWFSYSMARFLVDYREIDNNGRKQAHATELLAVRIRNFGGVLQELAPGASLSRADVRLVVCRTSSRLAYLLYVTRGLLRQRWRVPGIDLAHSDNVRCKYLPQSGAKQPRIYVEADGEILGTLPAEITAVPDALTLLAP